MAVSHVYSQTVADGTATSVVRPSDWNSAHNQYVTISGNTAGQSTLSGTNVVFQGGNNVTLSVATAAGAATIVMSGVNTVAQTNQTAASGNIAGTGFTSTTTAGTAIVGTNNTAGLSIGVPQFLTTAAQSSLSNVSQVVAATNNTGGGTATLTGGVSFSNANSFTFYTSAGNAIVASGNFQSTGAYLTTARASNDAIGTNTAQSNVTWTANSAGLSLDARGYAGTGTSATNASVTLNSNGLAISVAAGGGGGFTGGVSTGGNTLGNTGTQTGQFVLAGGNNITLSVATAAGGAQTITISGAAAGGAQTAISSVAVGGTTYTSGSIQFVNSNNFTFLSTTGQGIVGSFSTQQSTQPVAISGSNGSFAFSTVTFGNLNGLSHYTSNGSLVASYTVPTQSVQPVAVSGSNGSFAFSTVTFGALNGASFYTSNGSVVASYTVPNVPAQTNQTVGLYAGGNTTGQSSSSTFDARSISFSGAGIASVGYSAGSVIVSVPAGGGGGDGYNIVSMLTSTSGGGTAGATFSTLSGSIGLMAGSNITLSQTSNTIVINAAAGGGGGGVTLSDWLPFQLAASATTSFGNNILSFVPLIPQAVVSMTAIEMLFSASVSSTSTPAWSQGKTLLYGIYQETNGTGLTLLGSSSMVISYSGSSNATFAMTVSQGTNSFQSTTASSAFTAFNQAGFKAMSLPFATSINPNSGPYYFAYNMSTASSGANVANTLQYLMNNELSNASLGAFGPSGITASNRSLIQEPYGFIYSAATGGMSNSYAISDMSIQSNTQPYIYFEA